MKENNLGVAAVSYHCPICLKETEGSVILNRKLNKNQKEKVEALHGNKYLAEEPCEECKKDMEKAFLFIIANQKKSVEGEMPYRTGRIVGVRKEAAKKILEEDQKGFELGYGYIDIEEAFNIGLYNSEKDPKTSYLLEKEK